MGRLGEKLGSSLAENSRQGTTEQRGCATSCSRRGKSLLNTLLLVILGGVMSHASFSAYSVCRFIVCACCVRARALDKYEVVGRCAAACVRSHRFVCCVLTGVVV